jgi:beta-lactamase superfamily II metal-dependent hydrolase
MRDNLVVRNQPNMSREARPADPIEREPRRISSRDIFAILAIAVLGFGCTEPREDHSSGALSDTQRTSRTVAPAEPVTPVAATPVDDKPDAAKSVEVTPDAAKSFADTPVAAKPVAPSPSPTMRVHFIDVGQGASTLFEFPRGAVLVDTGGETNDQFNCGAQLEHYLDAFFERRPDLGNSLSSLIITHPHLDHTRNIQRVVERYAPRNIVTNGITAGSGAKEQNWLQQYASAHQAGAGAVGYRAIHREEVPPGGLTDNVIDPVIGPDVDPRLFVLWGQVATDPGWGKDRGRSQFENANNHSVVVRVEFGRASVIVTGDLQDVAIHDMIRLHHNTAALRASVYEVGHHGSINGTTNELLDAMKPNYAVIEMGPVERHAEFTAWAFGHPRGEIVSMLERAIPTMREAIDVQVGLKSKEFEHRTLTKAIYATGWDGNIVLEGTADGVVSVVSPAPVGAAVASPGSGAPSKF